MSLESYMSSLKNYPPLSKKEIRKLIKKAQNGSISARNKVITANLRLVVSTIKKFGYMHNPQVLDYISEGNISLIKALQNFNLDKNITFSTYATWYIRAKVSRFIQNNRGQVRTPVHSQERVQYLIDKKQAGERITIAEEKRIQQAFPKFLSVDKTLKTDGKTSFLDVFVTDNKFFDQIHKDEKLNAYIKAAEQLDTRSQYIMDRRMEGGKLEDIAFEIGVTRERVRQIQKVAMANIKKWLKRRKQN